MASSSSNLERLRGDGTSGLFQLSLTAASARPAAPGSATMRGRLGVLARRGSPPWGRERPRPLAVSSSPPSPRASPVCRASSPWPPGKGAPASPPPRSTSRARPPRWVFASVFWTRTSSPLRPAPHEPHRRRRAPPWTPRATLLPLENHGVRCMSMGFPFPPRARPCGAVRWSWARSERWSARPRGRPSTSSSSTCPRARATLRSASASVSPSPVPSSSPPRGEIASPTREEA